MPLLLICHHHQFYSLPTDRHAVNWAACLKFSDSAHYLIMTCTCGIVTGSWIPIATYDLVVAYGACVSHRTQTLVNPTLASLTMCIVLSLHQATHAFLPFIMYIIFHKVVTPRGIVVCQGWCPAHEWHLHVALFSVWHLYFLLPIFPRSYSHLAIIDSQLDMLCYSWQSKS